MYHMEKWYYSSPLGVSKTLGGNGGKAQDVHKQKSSCITLTHTTLATAISGTFSFLLLIILSYFKLQFLLFSAFLKLPLLRFLGE